MDLSQIQDRWGELLMIVGAIGVAAEGTIAALLVLVGALRSLAGFLAAIAMQTGTAVDDRAIAKLSRGLDTMAAGLEKAQRWIPRLRTGGARKAIGPRGTAMLGVLLALGVGLSGCGQQRVVRTAIDVGGHVLVTADEIGASEYRRVEERCDASATSIEEWRECMAPGFRLEEALRHVYADLLAGEAAADAAGSEGFARIAPCIARSLDELATALEALRVELPDKLRELRGIVDGFGGACVAPEEG